MPGSSASWHFSFHNASTYTVSTMEPTPATNRPVKKAYGSVLSILLIVLILVVGAFYVWNKRVAEQPQQATPDDATITL